MVLLSAGGGMDGESTRIVRVGPDCYPEPPFLAPGGSMRRREFIGQVGLAAMAALSPPLAHARGVRDAQAAAHARLLPSALKPGDTVALVAPSAAIDDPFSLQLAQEAMEALGLRVKRGEHVASRRGHLAGADADRAGDLNAMFADTTVKAIVCARGGAGAARLLPLLDYAMIRRNPKILLGYSDITALHNALLSQAGLLSFHGPTGNDGWSSFNADQFRRVFFERERMEYRNPSERGDELVQRRGRTITVTGGKARGALVGGNLTVLTALCGTPYLPDFDGAILFLEDVDEAPYRIDRMLTTLKLSGALDRVAGVVFGACTSCTPGDGYGSLTLSQIFEDWFAPLKVPAYHGAQFGHIRQQFILPVGAEVELDADAGTLRMLEPVFRG